VTAGPLVPCYDSGLAGQVFQWTDGNCYQVTAIKSQAAATYTPTETWDTCDECNDSDKYIQAFLCNPGSSASSGGTGSGGEGTLWFYVPAWIASGWNYYWDGSNCWQISAGNPRLTSAALFDADPNATRIDTGGTPGITSCATTPCPCPTSGSQHCIQLGTSVTFTPTASGILMLLYNDSPGNFGDNTGAFTVTVTSGGNTWNGSVSASTSTGTASLCVTAGVPVTVTATGTCIFASFAGCGTDADGDLTEGDPTTCNLAGNVGAGVCSAQTFASLVGNIN
jgi:hypothetical protein